MKRNNFILGIIFSSLVSVAVAVFLFNIPFWCTLGFNGGKEVDFRAGSGLIADQDALLYRVIDTNNAYIELNVEQITPKNIKLDFSVPNWTSSSFRDSTGPYIDYHIEVKDSSNSDFLRLPDVVFQGGNAQSHVLRLSLAGNPELIRVYVHLPNDALIGIGKVHLDAAVPFILNPLAIIGTFLLSFIVFALRPSSCLYQRVFCLGSTRSYVPFIILVGMEVLFVLATSRLVGVVDAPGSPNIDYDNGVAYDYNQYNYLADAIIDGRTALDLPVSTKLSELESPYDRSARHEALAGSGEYYYLDYAYYEGDYYSYFGVLPALAFFVPYKLITGLDLRTDRVVSLLVCIYVIAVNFLIVVGAKRIGKKASIAAVSLASISAVLTSGLLYLAYLPQLYSVPILMGLILVFLGLSFWIIARSDNEGQGYRRIYLAGGSVLIALSVACRPQYVLACLLAFPIFWKGIVKERAFFSRKGAINTLLVMMPFIVVALPVMAYNYLRFDSPFDFGASYNLTGSDMTSRGIDLGRCLPATFQYLFQPLNLSANYPFVKGVDLSTNYQGFWFYEPFLGGFFSFCPLVYCLFCIKAWWQRHDVSSRLFVSTSLLLAGIILFADFQIASITTRYFNDFSWLLLLAVWYMLFTESDELQQHVVIRIVVSLLVALGVVLNVLALFSPDRYAPLHDAFPSLYYGIATLHQGLL